MGEWTGNFEQVLHVAMDGWRSSMVPVMLNQGTDMWLLNSPKTICKLDCLVEIDVCYFFAVVGLWCGETTILTVDCRYGHEELCILNFNVNHDFCMTL